MWVISTERLILSGIKLTDAGAMFKKKVFGSMENG